jgi:hypothetical protein
LDDVGELPDAYDTTIRDLIGQQQKVDANEQRPERPERPERTVEQRSTAFDGTH